MQISDLDYLETPISGVQGGMFPVSSQGNRSLKSSGGNKYGRYKPEIPSTNINIELNLDLDVVVATVIQNQIAVALDGATIKQYGDIDLDLTTR